MDYPKSDASARLLNDKFTDGDPVGGVPASKDSANYQNMVFDELIGVISAAGLAPDEADMTQLAQAISKLTAKPLGQPFWHQGETAPVGAMEYAGQILSRATYPELWAALNDANNNFTLVTQADAATRPGCWHTGDDSTTFGAPMVLGEFLRVWDSSGVIDVARVLGSGQAGELESHDHVSPWVQGDTGTNQPTLASSQLTDGPVTQDDIDLVGFRDPIDNDTRGSTQTNDMKMRTTTTGGVETRPRNVAWMLCFRYQQ